MARRGWRLLLSGALLLAVAALVRRSAHLRAETASTVPSPDPWPPISEAVRELEPEEPVPAWLSPLDGACPPSHPIKAKAASGIYHLPGMVNYNRTKPDRCYAEEAAAESDGLRRANH